MNELKNIKVNNKEINYGIIHGGDKAFVMLPGISLCSILANINAIEMAYEEILKEYTIYVFDHATPDNDNYTMDEMVNDIIFTIDQIGLKKNVIYGVSIGGLISLKMSIIRPDLFEKMIVVASTLKVDKKQLKVLRRWEAMSNNYEIENMNRDFFTTMFTSDYVNNNLKNLDLFIHNGNKHDCECFSRVIRTMYDFDIEEKIKNVKIETFVLGGDLDSIFGEAASRQISEALKADLYIYKNYSHAFYDEALDFKHRLITWLNRN